jgi:hypothetical protein
VTPGFELAEGSDKLGFQNKPAAPAMSHLVSIDRWSIDRPLVYYVDPDTKEITPMRDSTGASPSRQQKEQTMHQLTAEIILTGLVTAFAGILLFIAEVVTGVFMDMKEIAFRDLMALVYRRASRSVVLTITGAGPALAVFPYIYAYRFANPLFLVGMLIFWLSLVASNVINIRIYRRIQASRDEDTRQLSEARLAIGRANWFRAALAAVGAAMMLASL